MIQHCHEERTFRFIILIEHKKIDHDCSMTLGEDFLLKI